MLKEEINWIGKRKSTKKAREKETLKFDRSKDSSQDEDVFLDLPLVEGDFLFCKREIDSLKLL